MLLPLTSATTIHARKIQKIARVNNRELNLISDDIILFNEKDLNILKELCEEEKLNVSIMQDIFNVEKKYMGYNNRQEVNKTLRKLLSQEFIHIENQGDNNEN